MTCDSRGISASTFDSTLPRETCTAPGMRPRFTSLGSRTSKNTEPSLSRYRSMASRTEISRIRALASLSNCCPVFISRNLVLLALANDAERKSVRIELGMCAEWKRPLIVDVAHRRAGDARHIQRAGHFVE